MGLGLLPFFIFVICFGVVVIQMTKYGQLLF